MANKEINDLDSAGALTGTEEIELQLTAGGLSKKTTAQDVANLAPGGGGGANLSTTRTTTAVTVVSDSGTDAIIPAADTDAGVMTGAMKSKLDGIEAGATTDQTAAEILTAIKTVDGSGSGLDADLLDGNEATALLARANHTGSQTASTISDFSTASDARIAAAAGVSVASLSGGKVPTSQIPALALVTVQTAVSQAAQLALTTQEGDVVVRTDENKTYMRNAGTSGTMTDFTLLNTPTDAVTSVNGQTGVVVLAKGDVGLGNVDNTSDATKNAASATLTNKTLTSPVINTPTGIVKGDVGLGNVDNTSDASKPVSTATQTALDAKVTGPASVTDDLPAIFDGITGKLIKSKTYAAFKTLLSLVKGDVGLGNVDNTSDVNKPVSTAQAAADAAVLAATQPLDSDLTTIAGLTPTTDNMIQSVSGVWASRTPAQVKTALGLVIGTNVQAQGPTLDTLEALSLVAGDILYATGADTLTRLPKGTALQQLRINAGATAPEWATAGGGQTLYESIVATSGGDYTTLGAAVTAGKTRIFVRNGTYTEVGNITLAAGTVLRGESRQAIIDLGGSYTITMTSGSRSSVSNIGIKGAGSSGGLAMNGAGQVISDVYFENVTSQTGSFIIFGGTSGVSSGLISNCIFNKSAGTGTICIETGVNGASNLIIDSCFAIGGFNQFLSLSNTTNAGVIVSNNYIYSDYTSHGNLISQTALNGTEGLKIIGNIIHGSSSGRLISTRCTNAAVNDNNLVIGSGGTGIYIEGTYCSVIGNQISGGSVGIDLSGAYALVSTNQINSISTGIIINGNAQTIIANMFQGNSTNINISTYVLINIQNNHGLRPVDERRIIRVKNTSGGTLTAGTVVVYKSAAAGDEVTTTTTAGDKKAYGVLEESINDGSFGFMLIQGKTTLLKADGTTDIAVGDWLSCFTTAGIAQKATESVAGVTVGDTAFAVALEAYTANNSSGVLDALLIPPRPV